MKKFGLAAALTLTLLLSSAGMAMANPTDDRIVSSAESYIGKVTYKFGVNDPAHLTFDCSSFTQFIFKQNGIALPWGSKALAHVGTLVQNKASLQKGDIILFSVGTPGVINHVGIYIGNGQFIHNHPGRGVEMAPLNTGYWQNRFIEGRHL